MTIEPSSNELGHYLCNDISETMEWIDYHLERLYLDDIPDRVTTKLQELSDRLHEVEYGMSAEVHRLSRKGK